MNRRAFLTGLAAVAAGGGSTLFTAGCSSVPRGLTAAPPVSTWKGSPFEIGLRHGRELRDAILREAGGALRSLAARRRTSDSRALEFYLSAFEPCFRDHAPSALEEIRGISQGSGLDYPHAFFAATRDGSRIPAEQTDGCTAVYADPCATADGHALIGQTKDTAAPLSRYRIQRLEYASGRRAIVLNYPGWIANLCLTSDGVSFTGNSLFARGPEDGTVPFSFLKRLLLEKGSIAEVLAVARRFRFENAALLMADAQGCAVSWEGVAGRIDLRNIAGEAFGHANSVLCPALKEHETSDVVPCSPVRQRNVQAGLDRLRGRLSVRAIQELFSDHRDYPRSICRHPVEDDRSSTTAAFVADLTVRTMSIAIGNPCASEFVTYGLDF